MLIMKYALTALLLVLTAAAAMYLYTGGVMSARPVGAHEAASARQPRQRRPASLLLGILTGLILYFAAQSAVARRIGWDLFLPVSGVDPLPGRAALFAACLLVSLAAALTDRGRALCGRLNASCGRECARWIAAGAVTVLFLLWTLRVTVLSYMTNDDVSIMRAIARIPEYGLATAADTYSNLIFCAMLGAFYKLDPDVYWYFGYHMAVLLSSITVIGRCILVKLRYSVRPLLYGCLIHAALCAGVFTYAFAAMSFTVTPALAGAAAIALILCRNDAKTVHGRVLTDVFSVLLMLLCNLQRHSTGRALLCFWGLAAAYHIAKLLTRPESGKNRLKRVALFLPCILLTAVLASVRSPAIQTESDPAYDDEADYYRLIVTDYLMEDLTAEQWESVGIPPELGNMIRSWYFMDERVNTDTFRQLVQLYYYGAEQPADTSAEKDERDGGGGLNWSGIIGEVGDAAHTVTAVMLAAAAAVLLLMLLAVLRFIRCGRKGWPELLCSLFAAGGAAILCGYLVMIGRFPLRAFLVIAIPALVTLLIMDASVPEEGKDPACRPALTTLSVLCAAGLCVTCMLSARGVPHIREYATRDTVFGEQHAIENYVNSYPDIKFYTNLSSHNLDPLHGASYPYNMELWGHVGMTAYAERDYADAFFRDDIRLMYAMPSTIMAFFQYLTLDNGPVGAVIEAQLTADIYVANVFQASPGVGYTGWYEQNGMTYYFIDGRAVTGTQVIDGAEYTFAPPGSAVKLVILPGGDSLIYTTDAYSLISGAQ